MADPQDRQDPHAPLQPGTLVTGLSTKVNYPRTLLPQLPARTGPDQPLPNPELKMTLGQQFAFDPIGTAVQAVKGALVGGYDPEIDTSAHGAGALAMAALPVLTGARALDPRALIATAGEDLIGGKRLGTLARTTQFDPETRAYTLRAPTTERLSDFHDVGRMLPESNWAGSQSDELIHAFGGDQQAAKRWARIWGAVSPGTDTVSSTRESVSALRWALEHPNEALSMEVAQGLPGRKITMAPSKVPNINRALLGEPLSGDKAEAMAGFMTGEPRIPIDVHALYGLGARIDKLDTQIPGLRALMTRAEAIGPRRNPTTGVGGLTNTEIYTRYEEAVKDALGQIPSQHEPVGTTFGTAWEGIRAVKGLSHQGGPVDLLRTKGLLKFGAMLDPERLAQALKDAGWSIPAVGALLAAVQTDGERDRVGTPPPPR